MPANYDLDPEELRNRFRFHPANTQARQQAHEKVRELFLDLIDELFPLLPASREKFLVFSHLDDACMTANAAIARWSTDTEE